MLNETNQTSPTSVEAEDKGAIHVEHQGESEKNQGAENGSVEGFGVRRAKIGRWTPKRWDTKYDQIVIISTLGLKSNIDIAKDFNMTPQHISNILNTPQASKLRKAIHDKIQADISADIPMRLERIAAKGVERIEAVINSDEMFMAKPLEVVDRVLKLLHGVGKMKGEGSGDRTVNAIIFNTDDVSALREAMRVSDEAKKLNAPKPKRIKDPFEIVQKEGTNG